MAGFRYRGVSPGSARLGLLLFVGAAAIAPSTLRAAELLQKPFVFQEAQGTLLVSAGFREVFDSELRARLRSGFATTVVMRIALYRADGTPVALAATTLHAVYDLWEQVYRLKREDAQGVRVSRMQSEAELVDRLTSLWRFPLVPMQRIAAKKHYFVAVVVEVNPLDENVLQEVRRWLRSPPDRQRSLVSESFFGSFVSIFVNSRVRRAERLYKVRSQPFFRP